MGIRKVYGVYGWVYGRYTGYTGGIRVVYVRYTEGMWQVYGGYTGGILGYTGFLSCPVC